MGSRPPGTSCRHSATEVGSRLRARPRRVAVPAVCTFALQSCTRRAARRRSSIARPHRRARSTSRSASASTPRSSKTHAPVRVPVRADRRESPPPSRAGHRRNAAGRARSCATGRRRGSVGGSCCRGRPHAPDPAPRVHLRGRCGSRLPRDRRPLDAREHRAAPGTRDGTERRRSGRLGSGLRAPTLLCAGLRDGHLVPVMADRRLVPSPDRTAAEVQTT
jgi:hypothetical protein